MISADIRDNLIRMEDAAGVTTYVYDAANRLISRTDPNGFTVGSAYDEGGNLIRITYPGNHTVSYTYDALNRIKTVTIDWLAKTAFYDFDDAGRITDLTHFNGTVVKYGYDEANRLTSLENLTAAGGAGIATYSYTLDGNGNRTRIAFGVPSTNEIASLIADYSYNNRRNRLLGAGALTFTYDDEGQIATGSGSTYGFDDEHRLVSISGTHNYQYRYDGAGNRLEAIRDGNSTRYISSASGNLLAEANGSNVIQAYYIYGAGLLAMVTPGGELYCYHFDGTGNTVALTDANKAVVNEYAYTPFGIIGHQQETLPQPFKYVGQHGVMGEPNGFYYMKARYYDPAVGKFISEDPIGFDGGDVNLYAYVLNNPILFIDPWGLCTGGFWNTAGIIGNGILKAGGGLLSAFGNEDLQRGTAQGFLMAGEVAALTHAAVAVKAYALFDIATGGPVTASIMVFAGTPTGQKIITEYIPSINPGALPSPTFPFGFFGWATGATIETMAQ